MDVCHNYQGIEAVLNKIKHQFPDVKKVRIAYVVSKKKKLDEIVELFNDTDQVHSIHVISRPHVRLMSADEAYHKIQSMDCKKLKQLIPMEPQDEVSGENPRSIFEQSDD